MKINEVFPGTYLNAADIDKDYTLEIEGVKLEPMTAPGKEEENKPVVYFKGADKGLVLNKTNWKRIEALLQADDSDDWVGKQITLTTEMVDAFGEIKPAIRVKINFD